MNTYRITHREKLVGWYYVEADNEDEAMAKFEYQASHGEIDFSDLEMVDSSDEAELFDDYKLDEKT